MRIVHIAAGDFFGTYGGGQVYVKNLTDAMISMGMDVCVISTTSITKPIFRDYRGHQLIEIPAGIDVNTFTKLLEELQPDVVHAHSLKAMACKVGRSIGVPVVVTSHHGGILCPAGSLLDWHDEICGRNVCHKDCLHCMAKTIPGAYSIYPLLRMIPKKGYLKIGKWLSVKRFIFGLTPLGSLAKYIEDKRSYWNEVAQNCSRIVAPCQKLADVMVVNNLPQEKVSVVPHGIPLPTERPPFPEIKNGILKFYYVGRICYVKGLHILLKAFHSVDASEIELHLIGGVGNKREERYMRSLQRDYSGDSRIIWHGKIAPNEVYNKTREYHVACSPSICLEAFGLNIAEALALGKPVLSTKSGGGEQQINDGINGWLVEPNDYKALADKMREIVKHPELLRQMSKNCKAIAMQEHVNELMGIFRDVNRESNS